MDVNEALTRAENASSAERRVAELAVVRDALSRMRRALEDIAETGCIDMGGHPELRCCDPGASDDDGLPLTPEEWCHPCVAHDALVRVVQPAQAG